MKRPPMVLRLWKVGRTKRRHRPLTPPREHSRNQTCFGETYGHDPAGRHRLCTRSVCGVGGGNDNATDDLVEATEDVVVAAHLYAANWGETRPRNTLLPDGLMVLDGLVDGRLCDYAMDVARKGVSPKGAKILFDSGRTHTRQ